MRCRFVKWCGEQSIVEKQYRPSFLEGGVGWGAVRLYDRIGWHGNYLTVIACWTGGGGHDAWNMRGRRSREQRGKGGQGRGGFKVKVGRKRGREGVMRYCYDHGSDIDFRSYGMVRFKWGVRSMRAGDAYFLLKLTYLVLKRHFARHI